MALKTYIVNVNGLPHTVQFSEAEAKLRGLTAADAPTKKAATAPKNKAAKPAANKTAKPAADEAAASDDSDW